MRKILLLSVLPVATLVMVFVGLAPVASADGIAFEIHQNLTTNPLTWGSNASGISKIVETWKSFSNQRICTVKTKVAATGNPTDNLVLSVYHDPSDSSATPENGTKIGEVSISASSLPTSADNYVSFNFTGCLQMVTDGNYSFVWTRSNIAAQGGFVSLFAIQGDSSITSSWILMNQYGDYWQEKQSWEWSFRLEGPDPADNVLLEIPDYILTTQSTWGKTTSEAGTQIAQTYQHVYGWWYPSLQGVCQVSQRIAQTGNPQDNVILEVYSAGSTITTPQAGIKIASATVRGSALPNDTSTYTTFHLNNCIDMQENEIYWFVWSRSSPNSQGEYITKRAEGNYGFETTRWYFNDSTNTWVGDAVNDTEWSMRLLSAASAPAPSFKEPVLIVPGMLGTEIKKGDETLWADIFGMMSPFNGDSFMDPLGFTVNLDPSDPSLYPDKVLRKISPLGPIKEYNYTDGLINLFTSSQIGYTENQDLFTFPYDWRFGVDKPYIIGQETTARSNADRLRDRIDDILKTPAGQQWGKVDIIAHSLGGLVVKKYVMDHPSDNHIDKSVFVGVPNLGAPKAYEALIHGDNSGVPGLNPEEMKKIAQNMPVAYDAAPTREYYNQAGSFFAINDPFQIQSTRMFKNTTYDEAIREFDNQHLINSQGLINSEDLHTSSFDNFDLRTAGVDMYNILGCKAATFGNFTETINRDGIRAFDFPTTTTGDGTVPLVSAQNTPANNDHIFFAIKADHGKMLSADGTRQQIVNIITGSNLSTGPSVINHAYIQAHPEKCALHGEIVKIKSPVAIDVIDQDGNHSGLVEDGSIENAIPGADYEIWGEHKYVFLPTGDGEQYTVNLQGTGNGIFTVQDETIADGQTVQTQVFADLPVTTDLKGQIELGTMETILTLDNDGNGTVDQTLSPATVLTPDQSGDILAPDTKYEISGIVGDNDWYKSDVTIALEATDDNSGILETLYSLDGGLTLNQYTSPISMTSEGANSLKYYSVDKAGNNETIKTLEIKIDKTVPELSTEPNLSGREFNVSSSGSISGISFTETKTFNPPTTVPISVVDNNASSILGANDTITIQSTKKNIRTNPNQKLLIKKQQVISNIYLNSTKKPTIWKLLYGRIVKEVVRGLKLLQVTTDRGKISSSIH